MGLVLGLTSCIDELFTLCPVRHHDAAFINHFYCRLSSGERRLQQANGKAPDIIGWGLLQIMNDPLHPHSFTQHSIPTSSHLFPSTQGPAFASQHGLGSLEYDPFAPDLDAPPDLSNPFDTSPPQYDSRSAPRFHEIRPNAPLNPFHPPLQPPTDGSQFGALPPRPAPRQQQQQQQPQQPQESVSSGGQFGVLTPHPQHLNQGHSHNGGLEGLSNDLALRPTTGTGGDTDGHFSNMKIIPDPPNLDVWRHRLFDVDDPITLTEEE